MERVDTLWRFLKCDTHESFQALEAVVFYVLFRAADTVPPPLFKPLAVLKAGNASEKLRRLSFHSKITENFGYYRIFCPPPVLMTPADKSYIADVVRRLVEVEAPGSAARKITNYIVESIGRCTP